MQIVSMQNSSCRHPFLRFTTPALASFALAALALWAPSCATSGTQGRTDSVTQHVGQYSSPVPGLGRMRVGVPDLKVSSQAGPASLGGAMADVLTTLAFQTGRFDVVERASLDALLAEQDLEGIVLEDERAEMGVIRGVDALLLGKITDLRAKTVRKDRGFGLGNLGIKELGRYAGTLDYSREEVELQAECGVDLRLVDPSSGTVLAAHFGSYSLVDSASAIGLQLAGFGSKAAADLQLTDDDRGKVMRLALDNAMRKILPDVDARLQSRALDQNP